MHFIDMASNLKWYCVKFQARGRGGGGDLVSTIPGCVCGEVKDVGHIWLKVSDMSEMI